MFHQNMRSVNTGVFLSLGGVGWWGKEYLFLYHNDNVKINEGGSDTYTPFRNTSIIFSDTESLLLQVDQRDLIQSNQK